MKKIGVPTERTGGGGGGGAQCKTITKHPGPSQKIMDHQGSHTHSFQVARCIGKMSSPELHHTKCPLVQPPSCTYYAISAFPLHNSSNTLWPIESVCHKAVILVTYTVQTVVCKGHQISSALTPFPHMMCAICCRVGLNFHSPVWGESISSTMCPLRGEEFPVELLLVPGSGYHPPGSGPLSEHLYRNK